MRALIAALTAALLLVSGVAQAADPLLTAGHHGVWNGATVDWRSTFIAHAGPHSPARLELAVPLPAELEPTAEGANLVRDDEGAVVALELTSPYATVRLRQAASEGEATLRPPIPVSAAIQRVTLDGAAFHADPALGIDRRISHSRQPEIERHDRRRVDKRLDGRRAHASEHPLYLVVDSRFVDTGGLRGTLSPEGAADWRVSAAMAGLFLGALALIAAALKLLERFARREAVDAYIKRELGRGAEEP